MTSLWSFGKEKSYVCSRMGHIAIVPKMNHSSESYRARELKRARVFGDESATRSHGTVYVTGTPCCNSVVEGDQEERSDRASNGNRRNANKRQSNVSTRQHDVVVFVVVFV
jgi:hypothetical protein